MVRRANPGEKKKKKKRFLELGGLLLVEGFRSLGRYRKEAKESREGDWERDRESLKGMFFWLSEDTKQE